MYQNSKLLMNNLYGRFGMSPHKIYNFIIKNESVDKFIANSNSKIVEDIIDLHNGKSLILYKVNKIYNDEIIENNNMINVAMANSITAYARITMSKWLTYKNINIWMTDNDSLINDTILSTSNELGEFKL